MTHPKVCYQIDRETTSLSLPRRPESDATCRQTVFSHDWFGFNVDYRLRGND